MSQSTSLIIYPGYVRIELALAQDATIVDRLAIDKRNASRDFVTSIDMLLGRNKLSLSALSFCAAHVGPGPFTTLRSALATANGLAFAITLPLVGVDGFDAFIEQEKSHTKTPYLAIILNAFCGDAYYALYNRENDSVEKGCAAIEDLVEHMRVISSQVSAQKNTLALAPLFTCVGNGVELYKKELAVLDQLIFIPGAVPHECSLESIVKQAYMLGCKQEFSEQLLPFYLKSFSARPGKMLIAEP